MSSTTNESYGRRYEQSDIFAALTELLDGSVANVQIDSAPPATDLSGARKIILWHGDYAVGELGIPGTPVHLPQYYADHVSRDVLARAEAEEALDRSETFDVDATIVICTRNRPEHLSRCLAALPLQTCRPVQVLVVDNASDDDQTRAVAEAACVDYVREDRPGLDFARNRGVREARGSFILFTDDDVVLHPRWLERMVRAFADDHADAVTGLVLPATLETDAQRHFEQQWGFGRGFARLDFGSDFVERNRATGIPAWEIGAGASMAFRRSCFERFGMFDERLDVGAAGCSGDSEYWHRVLTNGGTCRYEPGAIAFHYHRADQAGLAQQLRAYLKGHAAALLVQHERTPGLGDVRRLLGTLPRWYAYLLLRRALGERTPRTRFLSEQIRGSVEGVVFYYRAPRDLSSLLEMRTNPVVSGDDKALVSMIVPSYNAESTLDATLTSLRNQTHAKLEIIVVDDGSRDATGAVAMAHVGADARVRLIRQENGGVAQARNTGLAAASGEYVAFVDADDLCAPERTAKMIAALNRVGSECALAYTWSVHVDEAGLVLDQSPQSLHEGWVHSALCEINFVGNGSAAMVRTAVAREVGGFAPGLRAAGAQGCEDIDFYLKVAERHKFALVPEFLTGYRQSASNMSSDTMQMYRSFRMVERSHGRRVPAARGALLVGRKYVLGWLIGLAYRNGQYRAVRKLVPRLALISPRWAYNVVKSNSRNAVAAPLLAQATGTIADPTKPVRGGRFPIGEPVATARIVD